jgi:hypothetical protein
VRGVTRQVTLDAEFDGTGVNPNVALEAGGWLVSEKIKLEIATEATRAQ